MGRHQERRQRITAALQAYAAAQSERGRELARHLGMHVTDSLAVVEILRAEGRGEPLTPARLSERIGLSSGATSILLNRLETAGHVTRRREHADRRLVTLRSDPSVHASAAEFFAPVQSRMDTLLGRYSAAELDVVERFVTDLVGTADGDGAARSRGTT